MKEQRKFERFPITLPSRMEPITSGKKQIFEVKTRDISSSGAFIYTPEPFPQGTRFKLDMTVPSEKIRKLTGERSLLECEGSVVRSTTEGVAICFDRDCQIISLKGY